MSQVAQLSRPPPSWQKWNVPHARVGFISERRRSGGCPRAHMPGPVFAPLCVWNEPLGFTVWDQMQKEEQFGIHNFIQESKWPEIRRFKSGRAHRKVQQDQTGREKYILIIKEADLSEYYELNTPNSRSLMILWIIRSLSLI